MSKLLFVSLVFFTTLCYGQECSDVINAIKSREVEQLLERLSKKTPQVGERLFNSCLSDDDLPLCERVTITRIYSNLQLIHKLPISSIEKAKQALDLNKLCKSAEEEVEINLLLGEIYKSQGELETSLQYYLTARWLSENLETSYTTFLIHNNAALLQFQAGNYTEAIGLLRTAHHIFEMHPQLFDTKKKKFTVMDSYNTLALSYRNISEYDFSIKYFKKAHAIAVAIGDEFWQALTHGNIGTVYFKQSRYDSAKYYIQIDAKISRKHKEWASLINSYDILGTIAEYENDNAKAERYYDSIGNLLLAFPTTNYPRYYRKLSEINYRRKDYKRANDYFKIYHNQTDSIGKLEASKNLSLIQQKYDFDKKLAELELIKKDNQLKEKEISVQRGLLFGTISTVLLLFVLIYLVVRRYNQKRRIEKLLQQQIEERTRELTELNLELDTFLYRASHDFRGPLSTIMGLNHLGLMTIKDPDGHEIIKRVGEVARIMDKMLGKIASIHIINREVGSISEIPLFFHFQDIIENLNLSDELNSIQNAVAHDLVIRTDYRLLKIALENILENAVKFRNYGSDLHVNITASLVATNKVLIQISDNGKGIDATFLQNIFQPFYKGEHAQGNGLGLFLVKKCIEKIKGDITIESKVRVGTTVKIWVPHLHSPVEKAQAFQKESYLPLLKRIYQNK
ncbi:tetratricopeptide repeat-containing sensor histidine kinase [Chryseosolibacter indicus]|uniref:histidine kinase n=1 Tax=Chryseosolibacter indicus TaxID=2782351 RepID=A0ABS5VRU4_9BACT|nr:tetratricopeptide repeat-containing sensor histidine kinase [Chryseosolibacter indicus]MBT1703489.1 tetratricopeptide repeat-containing sensor histidine kinase [Chryseosolibacter indicus]